MLIHELLEHTAARLPEKVALICEGCSLTYGEFLHRAEAFASGLEGLGVGQGDRVALLPYQCYAVTFPAAPAY